MALELNPGDAQHALGPPAVLVVNRAPNPFTGMSGFESIRLEGLEPSMARPCSRRMGEEEAMEVCIVMDGHPLGIKLWSPDDDLPGAGAVRNTSSPGAKETYAGRRLIIGRTLTFSTAPRREEMLEPRAEG